MSHVGILMLLAGEFRRRPGNKLRELPITKPEYTEKKFREHYALPTT